MPATYNLPVLMDEESCAGLLAAEVELCETAGSLLGQGLISPGLNHHLKAVVLCNELLWAHEGGHPDDALLHLAARQLKCDHLSSIQQFLADA